MGVLPSRQRRGVPALTPPASRLCWRARVMWTILDHMKRVPLVQAKSHLSELVDAAEHGGRRILILRHGKPAAAIVPVSLATRGSAPRLMTQAQAEAFM